MPAGKADGEPLKPIEKVRAAVAEEDWKTALRIAKNLTGFGDDEAVIARAWEGLVRPEFLRQVNRDPEKAYEDGVAVLRRRFG